MEQEPKTKTSDQHKTRQDQDKKPHLIGCMVCKDRKPTGEKVFLDINNRKVAEKLWQSMIDQPGEYD